MAKFFGVVGYGNVEETGPGVWDNVIVEKQYFGDVIRNSRQLTEAGFANQNMGGGQVNPDITVGVSISIVADAYAHEHFFAMKYVKWMGALWTVQNVDVQSPRLILRLGGVYNGPKAGTPDTP